MIQLRLRRPLQAIEEGELLLLLEVIGFAPFLGSPADGLSSDNSVPDCGAKLDSIGTMVGSYS
jgi:hypothetical protein